MLILICYDVATAESAGRKRLRKVAGACQDYGRRVRNSVFECRVGKTQWTVFREKASAGNKRRRRFAPFLFSRQRY